MRVKIVAFDQAENKGMLLGYAPCAVLPLILDTTNSGSVGEASAAQIVVLFQNDNLEFWIPFQEFYACVEARGATAYNNKIIVHPCCKGVF
jgi:hypothetical protein